MRIAGFAPLLMAPFVIAAPLLFADAVVSPAAAQDLCARCDNLWYKRNAIYARNGYCFKTRRARAVFGKACFPPYGRMSRFEQQRVNNLKARENALGCWRCK